MQNSDDDENRYWSNTLRDLEAERSKLPPEDPADQRLFFVSDEQFKALTDLLDRPPQDNETLRTLLSRPFPWKT